MATTLNVLRTDDPIRSFAVGNHLPGKEPLPFGLLYWNTDGTRMRAATRTASTCATCTGTNSQCGRAASRSGACR